MPSNILNSILPNRYLRDKAFVGGEWLDSESRTTFEVINPATERVISLVPNCSGTDTELAIQRAQEALSDWKGLPPEKRGRIIKRVAELIRINLSDLAAIITLEQGKPLREAEKELLYGADYFEWFAEEGRRIYGETIPSSLTDRRILVTKEAIGVCAAITPWNFPHAMIARKMAAALAAGCTFICKPALETPLSALAIGVLCEQAELPKGVVSIIPGNAEPIARAIMKSEIVRKVSFTGSTEVGKILLRQSADTVKKLTLELGGNAPYLVFDDANIGKAAQDAVYGKFRNAGQTCICINRFLLHEEIKERFLELFIEETSRLKIGNGMEPNVDIGPLISTKAAEKVSLLVEDATENGAQLIFGSKPDGSTRFIKPIVIDNVNAEMKIAKTEIFGPVAAISTFSSEDEALKLANNSLAGLIAYVYTRDFSRAVRVSEQLQFGMVGVNDTTISMVQAPFGGIKHSGFGREGGHHGIDEYLNLKYMVLGINS